jgi:serine/threonine protein kinase
MTAAPHPYDTARKVLKALHSIFLREGHRTWSISADGFEQMQIPADDAEKALRLLVSKGLAEYMAQAFVITDYGVSACDHPERLDELLPVPIAEVVPRSSADAAADAEPLLEYVPAALRSRFKAVEHIGGGSFGQVYLALDRETLERFALKVTNPAPDARARAVREVDAARKLRHDHVLPTIDLDAKGDWFIFPLAEGTLGQLHSWGRLQEATPLEVALAVGSALAYAHGVGFLHRDLHVDNILRHDGRWTVADWGLTVARGNDRITRTRSVGGGQTWSAPEQLVSLKNADERSDLFSLGRIVEWLASGRLPDPTRPAALPDAHPLAAFVSAATQLSPDARPPSVLEAMKLLPAPGTPKTRGTAPAPRLPTVPKPTLDRIAEQHRVRVAELRERPSELGVAPDAPVLVLDLSPASAAEQLDLLPVKQGGFDPLPRLNSVHWTTRFNDDGLLAHTGEQPPFLKRLQVYRYGRVELLDSWAVQRIHAPKPVLFPLGLERDVVDFVTHWIEKILSPLEVAAPFVVCLSVVGIKNFELHIDDRPSFDPKRVFDRAEFSFPPAIVEGVETLRRQLKPAFDSLWQAAGEDRSRGYSPDGTWLDAAHPRR